MTDINQVILVGRLTRDSELKYSGAGTAVANFSVASSSYAGKDKENYTSYIDCVMFGKRAEAVNQYLVKGTQVVVNGSLKQSRWDSEGGKRSKVSITVSDIQMVGGKGKQEAKPQQELDVSPQTSDESIPF